MNESLNEMTQQQHILIVGAGSVGKRHARNFVELGGIVSCVDPRADRRGEFCAEHPEAGSYATVSEALSEATYAGGVVCSPTRFHVEQSLAIVDAGVPLLLEKPVSISLDDSVRLQEACAAASVPTLLGYTWRWWPPLGKVREHLEAATIGRLRHVKFVMSAHLADWHPGEPLAEFFMSSAALGGGALLDESHWLDLMVWCFGMPDRVFARVEKISDLDIDSDDNVDMVLSYGDGLRVTVHLDLYGRPHEKYVQFTGDLGTMRWSEAPNRISICHGAEANWIDENFDCERNDMFAAVAREFLSLLDGENRPTCTIDEGIDVMRIIEAARESQRTGAAIALEK